MNFATHVAIFAAMNSGLWFFKVAGEKILELNVPMGLPGTPWITGAWGMVLLAHGVYVFAIAQYPDSTTQVATSKTTASKPKDVGTKTE
jgi:hypothetical protein